MEKTRCLHRGCYWYSILAEDFCSTGCRVINEGYRHDALIRGCKGCKHCDESKRNFEDCCSKYYIYGGTPVASYEGLCRTRETREGKQ